MVKSNNLSLLSSGWWVDAVLRYIAKSQSRIKKKHKKIVLLLVSGPIIILLLYFSVSLWFSRLAAYWLYLRVQAHPFRGSSIGMRATGLNPGNGIWIESEVIL